MYKAGIDTITIISSAFILFFMTNVFLYHFSGDYKMKAIQRMWSQNNLLTNKNLSKDYSWKEYKVNENLKGPELDENDWSYPMFTIKHSVGFENTASDTLLPQDTVHIIHNAKCFSFLEKEGRSFSDTLSEMNLCNYKMDKNKLILSLYEESISNAEIVTIELQQKRFKVNYKTSYVFPYHEIKWEIKEKSLTLNQSSPVKKGTTLIGEINIKLGESIFSEKNIASSTRTKIIKGLFEVEIEK